MISTISQNIPFIAVSVGQDVRVRDSQKDGNVEAPRAIKEKEAEGKESVKVSEMQKIELESEKIEEVFSRLQESLRQVEPRIELSVDNELGQVIFRLFDKESGDLIKQIPSEEVLELDRFFAEQSGLLVEEEI